MVFLMGVNDPYVAPPPKSKGPLIAILIVSAILLCCGGVVGGAVWFFIRGMNATVEKAPFATEVLTKMSDNNYNLDSVLEYFDSRVASGVTHDQFQDAFDIYREKLGKFRKLGRSVGFKTEMENGITMETSDYEVEFEKANGTLSLTTRTENGKLVVVGLYIRSPALL